MTTTELRNKLEDIMVNFVVLMNPDDIFMVSDKKTNGANKRDG